MLMGAVSYDFLWMALFGFCLICDRFYDGFSRKSVPFGYINITYVNNFLHSMNYESKIIVIGAVIGSLRIRKQQKKQ